MRVHGESPPGAPGGELLRCPLPNGASGSGIVACYEGPNTGERPAPPGEMLGGGFEPSGGFKSKMWGGICIAGGADNSARRRSWSRGSSQGHLPVETPIRS